MTRFDLLKILSYIAAGGLLLTGPTLKLILAPWGVPDPIIGTITQQVGSVVLVATLIVNTLKNPSPPAGQVSVTAPATATTPLTSDELSTAPAPKVGT